MARVNPSDPRVTHHFQLFEIISDVQLWRIRSCVSPTWIRFHLSHMLQEAQCGSLGDAVAPTVKRSKANPHLLSFKEKLKVMSGWEEGGVRFIWCLHLCENLGSEGWTGEKKLLRIVFHHIKVSELNSREAEQSSLVKEKCFCIFLSLFKEKIIYIYLYIYIGL